MCFGFLLFCSYVVVLRRLSFRSLCVVCVFFVRTLLCCVGSFSVFVRIWCVSRFVRMSFRCVGSVFGLRVSVLCVCVLFVRVLSFLRRFGVWSSCCAGSVLSLCGGGVCVCVFCACVVLLRRFYFRSLCVVRVFVVVCMLFRCGFFLVAV